MAAGGGELNNNNASSNGTNGFKFGFFPTPIARKFPSRKIFRKSADADHQNNDNSSSNLSTSSNKFTSPSPSVSYSPSPKLKRYSSKSNFTPKFNPNKYTHGWLFPEYTQQRSTLMATPNGSLTTESSTNIQDEDPLMFRPAPVIFMFNLTPITPFFTRIYCFSNHYMCEKLVIDDMSFYCTEQYYMFYKARVFSDKEAMKQIMQTKDSKLMKRIGSNVKGFDQDKWYKIAIQVMVIASIKKYEQNPALRRQLFETAGTELVETSPTDERWGIGLSLFDWRLRDKEMWRGMNILGRLLTMLRDKLLERPEFARERNDILREINESLQSAKSAGCLQIGRLCG